MLRPADARVAVLRLRDVERVVDATLEHVDGRLDRSAGCAYDERERASALIARHVGRVDRVVLVRGDQRRARVDRLREAGDDPGLRDVLRPERGVEVGPGLDHLGRLVRDAGREPVPRLAAAVGDAPGADLRVAHLGKAGEERRTSRARRDVVGAGEPDGRRRRCRGRERCRRARRSRARRRRSAIGAMSSFEPPSPCMTTTPGQPPAGAAPSGS